MQVPISPTRATKASTPDAMPWTTNRLKSARAATMTNSGQVLREWVRMAPRFGGFALSFAPRARM
jgi:hypothetical protein